MAGRAIPGHRRPKRSEGRCASIEAGPQFEQSKEAADLRKHGKPGQVALVAAMRKLLLILNAMVKSQTPSTQRQTMPQHLDSRPSARVRTSPARCLTCSLRRMFCPPIGE